MTGTVLLSLPLFMPGIFFANNPHNAFPANNLAAIAAFFYRRLYFHDNNPFYL
jgi:hypothetical protein